MKKLLPCPFCGGEAGIERTGTPRQSCIVACVNCGARHESGDEAQFSGASWNRRTQPAPAITSESGKILRQGASAITSESAQAVALLTDDELQVIEDNHLEGGSMWDVYRAIEQAVRAKMGVAVPLLSEREIVKCLTASGCVGTVKMSYDSGPYEITRTSVNADRFARAIESLVRSKLGAGVPMTDEQAGRIAIDDGWNASDPEYRAFIDGIRAAERQHGIVGKEGGNV